MTHDPPNEFQCPVAVIGLGSSLGLVEELPRESRGCRALEFLDKAARFNETGFSLVLFADVGRLDAK